jgi:hypothetical protein
VHKQIKNPLKLGKHLLVENDKCLALAWKDKRVVTMSSTWHNQDTKEVCRKTAKEVEVSEACCFIGYAFIMGGMDREDDYCSSYRFLKKSLKWWRTSYF